MRDYYDSAQLAELLGIKRTSVHRYRTRGDIPEPDEYVGRTPVWKHTRIDEWLKSRPGHGWRKGVVKQPQTPDDQRHE